MYYLLIHVAMQGNHVRHGEKHGELWSGLGRRGAATACLRRSSRAAVLKQVDWTRAAGGREKQVIGSGLVLSSGSQEQVIAIQISIQGLKSSKSARTRSRTELSSVAG